MLANAPPADRPAGRPCCWRVLLCLLGLLTSGCVSIDNPASVQRLARLASIGTSETVVLKRVRPTPLEQVRRLVYQRPPEPSPRNLQLLRRYALLKTFQDDRTEAIDRLWELSEMEEHADLAAGVALLSLAEAQHHRRYERDQVALDWYVLSLVSASKYLSSPQLARTRNPYDPHFSEVTAAYNESLEHVLRFLHVERGFRGEKPEVIASRLFDLHLDCRVLGDWDQHSFEKIEFVSDFTIKGLTNHHRQYGLGVPLIAIRSQAQDPTLPSEKYYPPNLTLPVTAFLRVPTDTRIIRGERTQVQAVLEMIDPLKQTSVWVGNEAKPLAIDITAPLAYYLNDPLYRSNLLAHVALLNSEVGSEVRGIYMLEPYDPGKIPVVMVHGFWSSAITWTEMFNDLRANPLINQRYQFWFYMYPTGQPFWVSAKQMREDLEELQQTLDPEQKSLALDQMVLVGHSMGGLISYLQTVDSGDHLWRVMSDQPFDNLEGDPVAVEELRRTLFFQPNPQVKRVITLAMPFQGSDVANPTTRWLGRSLFKLPQWLVKANSKLVEANPGVFKNADLLTIDTSIDSLASDSPVFVAMSQVRPAPWTRYHNIYGRYQPTSAYQRWEQSMWGEGDGVVDVENAQFPYAHSVDEVDGRHMELHQAAKSIWIVRQALLQHLAESAPRSLQEFSPLTPTRLVDHDAPSPLSPIVDSNVEDNAPPSEPTVAPVGHFESEATNQSTAPDRPPSAPRPRFLPAISSQAPIGYNTRSTNPGSR